MPRDLTSPDLTVVATPNHPRRGLFDNPLAPLNPPSRESIKARAPVFPPPDNT